MARAISTTIIGLSVALIVFHDFAGHRYLHTSCVCTILSAHLFFLSVKHSSFAMSLIPQQKRSFVVPIRGRSHAKRYITSHRATFFRLITTDSKIESSSETSKESNFPGYMKRYANCMKLLNIFLFCCTLHIGN